MLLPLGDTQPSYSKPVVTTLLVAANLLVFLFEYSLDPYTLNTLIATFGLVPDHFRVMSVFTSMFLHAGWLHVLGNVWFLWIFGDNVEDILGHGKFLIFYLLCGVAACSAQALMNHDSRVPMVGASGAIAGVMGAYLVKFPHAQIRTFVFLIFIFFTEIPAWAMLLYWFVIQLFSGIGTITSQQYSQGGGTAFFAHVGGFLAGIVLIAVLGAREPHHRRRDLYW